MEQLVSKKIAEPSLAAKSATLERLEKARKKLDEAKEFIQLKPICAMTSKLSDLIWGRLASAPSGRRHAAAGGPAGDSAAFLAKVSFQILLTRPAAGWRRVSVGPRRNHDGHQDEVRGRARALPLPRVRLDRRGHHGSVSADRALAAAGRHACAPTAQRGGRLLEGAETLAKGPPLLHVVRPRPLPRGP